MWVLARPSVFLGVFDGYATFRRGRYLKREKVNAITRLLCRVELGPEFEGERCWVVPSRWDYANAKVDGRSVLVHRLAFMELVGRIPAGHDVHHRCLSSRCVNPSHLELVLDAEHARLHHRVRRASKGRREIENAQGNTRGVRREA